MFAALAPFSVVLIPGSVYAYEWWTARRTRREAR